MLDILSKILNIILAVLTFYLYFENRKLKGFEAEKKTKQRKAELKKLTNDYYQNSAGTVGFYELESVAEINKKESEFICKKNCLEAEIEELEKIVKNK